MWVRSPGLEDPLEEEMATLSSILAWEILWTEKPGDYSPLGSKKLDMTEQLSTHTISEKHWMPQSKCIFKRKIYFQCISFNLQHGRPSCFKFCLFSYQDIIKHSRIWRGNSRIYLPETSLYLKFLWT